MRLTRTGPCLAMPDDASTRSADLPSAAPDNGAPQQTGRMLGESLRSMRLKRGLSLEALSRASGLSRSGISKIERGEAVPSTSSLSRITEALGTSFAALVSPAIDAEVVVLKAADQPVMIDDRTGFKRRCISPILPSRGLDWVLNSLPRGQSTGAFVPHRTGVDEYIYVISGHLDATLGDASHRLEAGDALYFQAQVSHEFVAGPDAGCEYLLIIDNQAR